jgi:chemotaxis protein MotB
VGITGGCQNWKQKYEICNAEMENLQALFDGSQDALQQCNLEKQQMIDQLNLTRKQIDDVRAQLTRKKDTDLGFGGEKAKWDPDKGTITVTLESSILFDSGKASLKSGSKTRLGRIASTIKQKYPGKEISVVGHTDTDPIRKSKWKDNWQLSTERALAVTRYLIGQGIAPKQMEAAGRGEYKPVSGNKAENRRVEIVVHMR